jgi:hypothetical protein
MPESNGKQNWTAMLVRGNKTHEGFCFARSEYPDRVRYEADRMRWIIGELPERPDILAYDDQLHSGFVGPEITATAEQVAVAEAETRARVIEEAKQAVLEEDKKRLESSRLRIPALADELQWVLDALHTPESLVVKEGK